MGGLRVSSSSFFFPSLCLLHRSAACRFLRLSRCSSSILSTWRIQPSPSRVGDLLFRSFFLPAFSTDVEDKGKKFFGSAKSLSLSRTSRTDRRHLHFKPESTGGNKEQKKDLLGLSRFRCSVVSSRVYAVQRASCWQAKGDL